MLDLIGEGTGIAAKVLKSMGKGHCGAFPIVNIANAVCEVDPRLIHNVVDRALTCVSESKPLVLARAGYGSDINDALV